MHKSILKCLCLFLKQKEIIPITAPITKKTIAAEVPRQLNNNVDINIAEPIKTNGLFIIIGCGCPAVTSSLLLLTYYFNNIFENKIIVKTAKGIIFCGLSVSFILAGRPCHISAGEQMEMKVFYSLTCTVTAVGNNSEAV